MNRFFYLLSILFFMMACSGSSGNEEASSERPDFDQIQVLEIDQLYQISTFNEGEFFGYISNVSVADDNTVFVSDPRGPKIHLFDIDGNYLNFMGGDGEGPGEFRQLGAVSLITPDTLQTVDRQLARISFFAKEDGQWTSVKFLDRPVGAREYGSDMFFAFDKLYSHSDGYLGRFNTSFTPIDTTLHSYAYFRNFDYNLNPIDDTEYLMHMRSKPVVVRSSTNQSLSVMSAPEGFDTFYEITENGYQISNWNGSRLIKIQHILNDDSTEFEYISNHIEISDQEKTELAAERIPEPENAMLTREALKDYIPDYKPFSRQLLLDDQDRIWVLTRSFEEANPEWLIYNQEGELLAAANHPGGRFMQIKDNRIYVANASFDEEPYFSVYQITD